VTNVENYDQALAQAPQRLRDDGFLPPLAAIPNDHAPLRQSIIDKIEKENLKPL
jgi:hypothetical protein